MPRISPDVRESPTHFPANRVLVGDCDKGQISVESATKSEMSVSGLLKKAIKARKQYTLCSSALPATLDFTFTTKKGSPSKHFAQHATAGSWHVRPQSSIPDRA